MPWIFLAVIIGTIGLKNMLNPILKSMDKSSPVSAKFHEFDDALAANSGQFF